MDFRKITTITILVISISFLSYPGRTYGIIQNFGGTVATTAVCLNGIWFTINPANKPAPDPNFVGPRRPNNSFLLTTFVSVFRNYVPPRIGQKVIGKATLTPAPCLVPCPTGVCPIGYGSVVLFHGASL